MTTSRIATVPPRSRRRFPPIACAADLAAALQREIVVQAATGEPADLADDFGDVAYPCSVAATLGATLARAGRALADVVRMECDGDVERCTVREFVIANVDGAPVGAPEDDPWPDLAPLWLDAVATPIGGSFTVGGGAAPYYVNTREPRR